MTAPFYILAEVNIPPITGLGIVSMLMWALACTLLAMYIGNHATDLKVQTLADGQQLVRKLPLSFRLLLPFCINIKVFRHPRHEALRDNMQRQLVSAGYDTVITPADFLSLRLLMPLALGPIVCAIFAFVIAGLPESLGAPVQQRQSLLFLGLILFMAIRPRSWLQSTIKRRHREIERGLPFILDLLTLSVEAGLDFMTSLRRLVERRKVDALSEEFIRSIREMQVGRTRRDALKDMADRVNQSDLNSVISALIQADEMGVGIGTVLRVQADQMRSRRFQRAEKLANEAPVKLLFPLVCFIFPCVFLVLLGPIFLEMAKKGF